ncbi:putative metal-dependent hydrolase [Parabacteroides sp. PF5-5]|uniref:M48 family metallopeptidase n=1 Tax=unclassified Parabacteroides TaxID=2649774 RepID=UPI002474035C|nr:MULTISPECIES: SprT family zinc-dependent metalloprotease [unclassified Parabacteroides]MDH6303431.1 putative metal-dependent hydrolase [Parabacteroides sp. PH5-39]MDH6314754.1 putative metal-dependent hydrolase [Parabacteroides sp. PF5-13]MDH6318091.1 putative metal-dependent hydrolase [Parabacteroides sp. PH5-13]MDH6321978.1 putative metal-dependent hydrolase [Parabacteroides sp. PH5-8]MDH6326101.1 putative metal-dependent hydrolase [Parabacteroides sp. PH5-41]
MAGKQEIIQDEVLGAIIIKINPRAKRYSLRIKNGAITGTIPPGGTLDSMIAFIKNNRQKLILALQQHPVKRNILSDTTELQTNTFKLHIFRTERTNFYMNLKEGILYIACPNETNFDDEQVQDLLKKFVEQALRHEAKRILPKRLMILAQQHNFSYSGVRINNSKSRWGSCSSRKNINLSLSLMLLPDKLIDYVLLHELCHTKEMNHSDRFWLLMDIVTKNQALALRKELKEYKML